MRHQLLLQHSSRSLLDSVNQYYICRQCFAQARSRALHSAKPMLVDKPAWQRMRDALFGNKDKEEAKVRRENAQQAKVDEAGSEELQINESVYVKGVEYHVANAFSPHTNKDYIPATELRGMEKMGSATWIRRQADQGEKYSGFVPRGKRAMTDVAWKGLLRYTLIEILILMKNGRLPGEVCYGRTRTPGCVEALRNATLRIKGSNLKLGFAGAQDEKVILDSIERASTEARPSYEHHDYLESGSVGSNKASRTSWMSIPLVDPAMKLAIVKRIVQLTGHRLSDFELSKISTVDAMYKALLVEPPPKRLAASPQIRSLHRDLPNVTVYESRRTPIHKEQEVGRWKIIEEELLRRDLPLTGSKFNKSKILH